MKRTVALVREAVKHGKCVVIGLQSTGESGTVDQLEKNNGELDEFVSTARCGVVVIIIVSSTLRPSQTNKAVQV